MNHSMRIAYPRFISVFLMTISLFTVSSGAQEKPASAPDAPHYKDATLPIQDRVADLLPRMTLEEKVYQLTGGWDGKIEVIDPSGTFTTETGRQRLETTGAARPASMSQVE